MFPGKMHNCPIYSNNCIPFGSKMYDTFVKKKLTALAYVYKDIKVLH